MNRIQLYELHNRDGERSSAVESIATIPPVKLVSLGCRVDELLDTQWHIS
jgi:hypothetical protein